MQLGFGFVANDNASVEHQLHDVSEAEKNSNKPDAVGDDLGW